MAEFQVESVMSPALDDAACAEALPTRTQAHRRSMSSPSASDEMRDNISDIPADAEIDMAAPLGPDNPLNAVDECRCSATGRLADMNNIICDTGCDDG